MSKILALQTDPTTDGAVVLVPSGLATLNGLPIATQGSQLVYKGNPGDQPIEFASGVLLNNKALTFVGAKTAAGATILTKGNTTATIEPADKAQGADEGTEKSEPAEVSKTVELESDYPMLQIHELAMETAKSSFYLMMSAFFEEDIPIIAYEKLYYALKEKKEEMMPEIEVLSKGLNYGRKAAYNRLTKKIEVKESIVIAAVEGQEEEKLKALAELLQILLEEYGHFLDDVLRNEFSTVKGDASKDEGAVYSYYFTNYQITDKKIDYATAKIDGAETNLIVNLEEIVQSYEEQKARIEADFQEREKEFFKAGKGDISVKQYGHFDFTNKLAKDIGLNDLQMSWLYLGNYMRDMSQVVTPVTTEFTPDEHSEMDALDADMRGIFKESFFDALKLTRTNWTRVVEVMAASHTMAEFRPEEDEALESFTDKFMSNGKTPEEFLTDKATDLGLKVAQMGLDYVNFIKHFEGITEQELGVYRPEEHIDNPIYAAVYDNLSSPKSAYYCPPKKNEKGAPQTKPSIGDHFGMKRYIRNEENGVEKQTDKIDGAKGTGDYADGVLPTAVTCMKNYFKEGVKKYKEGKNDHEKNKGLVLIGSGLHILEDYFAHTNFCEILLIKHGVSVYPWVQFYDAELTEYGPDKKRFQFKNFAEPKKETKSISNGDLPYNAYYDITALYDELSDLGSLKLLPSFSYKGFYFTFHPKNGKKNLYRASAADFLDDVESYNEDPLHLKKLCIAPRMRQVYGYYNLTTELVTEDSSLINSADRENYPSQIPIVSGYFSGADTFHSLLDLAEKMFEQSKINWRNVLMTNDFKHSKGIQLMDMLIYHILTDLMLSQQEQGKSAKDTGVDHSKLMEYYKELIFMREFILGVAESARKRAGLIGIVLYLVDRLLNALYASVMNMVNSIAVEMLHSVNNIIKDWQSMQLVSDIGTNPSHTQLAKDSDHSPIHSLAGDLALQAVLNVGVEIKKMIDGSSLNVESLSNLMFETAINHMQHPCAANMEWADQVVQKWLKESVDRLEKLHEDEFAFHSAELFGKEVKEIITKLQSHYLDFERFLDDAYRGILDSWESLQKRYAEFKTAAERLFRRGKQYLKRLEKEADEYYDQIMKLFEKIKFLSDNGLNYSKEEQEFRILASHFQIKVDEILAGIEKEEIQEGEIDNLESSLKAYYARNIEKMEKEIYEKEGFEGKVYQYCYQDTQDNQYRKFGEKMNEYYAFRLKTLEAEKRYLAKSANEQIYLAQRKSKYSFLYDG